MAPVSGACVMGIKRFLQPAVALELRNFRRRHKHPVSSSLASDRRRPVVIFFRSVPFSSK